MAVNAMQYIKNVGKSFGYSAIDTFKEYNPAIESLASSAKDLSTELYESIQDFKGKAVGTDDEKGFLGKGKDFVKDLRTNLVDDLKSGNWYNKQRIDKVNDEVMSDMFGFDESEFDLDNLDDFDFDFDDDGSDGDDTEAIVSATKESTDSIVGAMDATGAKVAGAISTATVQSADYIVQANRQSSKALYGLNKRGFEQMTTGLAAINANVSTLLTLGEPLTTHMQNAATFYTKTSEYQTAVLEKLDKIIANTTTETEKGRRSDRTRFGDLFTAEGTLDFTQYFGFLKGQVNDIKENTLGMLDMIGGLDNIMKMGTASPMKLVTDALVKKAIPDMLKNSMTSFNEALGASMPAMMEALVDRMSKSDKFGGALSALADYLLPSKDFKTDIDTSNYNHGKANWTGESEMALKEVIPTYLSAITAALTGQEMTVYDYKTGKFISRRGVKELESKRMDRAARNAGGDFRNDAVEAVRSVGFSKKDEEALISEIDEYFKTSLKKGSNAARKIKDKDFKFAEFGLSEESLAILRQVLQSYEKYGGEQKASAAMSNIRLEQERYADSTRRMESENDVARSIFDNSTILMDGTIQKNKDGTFVPVKDKNRKVVNILGLDRFNNDIFFYLRGIWQFTGHLSDNIAYLGTGDPRYANNKSRSAKRSRGAKDKPLTPVREIPTDATPLEYRQAQEAIKDKYTGEANEEAIKKKSVEELNATIGETIDKSIEQRQKWSSDNIKASGSGERTKTKANKDKRRKELEDQLDYANTNGLSTESIQKELDDLDKESNKWGDLGDRLKSKTKGKDPITQRIQKIFSTPSRIMSEILAAGETSMYRLIYGKEGSEEDGLFAYFFKKGDFLFSKFDKFLQEKGKRTVQQWAKDTFGGLGEDMKASGKEAVNWMGKKVGDVLGIDLIKDKKNGKGETKETKASEKKMEEAADKTQKDLTKNGGAARGRNVTKTGVVSVSEGEFIVPAKYNPYYNGPVKSTTSQLAAEKAAAKAYFGNYAEGGTALDPIAAHFAPQHEAFDKLMDQMKLDAIINEEMNAGTKEMLKRLKLMDTLDKIDVLGLGIGGLGDIVNADPEKSLFRFMKKKKSDKPKSLSKKLGGHFKDSFKKKPINPADEKVYTAKDVRDKITEMMDDQPSFVENNIDEDDWRNSDAAGFFLDTKTGKWYNSKDEAPEGAKLKWYTKERRGRFATRRNGDADLSRTKRNAKLDKLDQNGYHNAKDVVSGSVMKLTNGIQDFANGIIPDKKGKDKEGSIIDKFVNEKSAEKLKDADIKGEAVKNRGAIGVGALTGAGVSLLTGAVLGPFLGAAIGGATGLIIKSDKVQNALFGDIDENGERKGNGILSKKVTDFMNKQLPSMGIGGGIGMVAGTLMGSPILGAMVGATIGFATKSDKVKKFIFGDENEDGKVIKKDMQEKIKKAIPNIGAGAIAGLIAGPFGIVGNVVVGSAIGYATTSSKFQDAVLGKMNDQGKREGGILGDLKTYFTGVAKDFKGYFVGYTDKDGNEHQGIIDSVKGIFTKVGTIISDHAKNIFGSLSKAIRTAMANSVKSTIKKRMANSRIVKGAKKVGKAAVGVAKAPFAAANRVLEGADKKLNEKVLKRGLNITKSDGKKMTAEERTALREKYGQDVSQGRLGGGRDANNYDLYLAGADETGLKETRQMLQYYLDPTKEYDDKINKETTELTHLTDDIGMDSELGAALDRLAAGKAPRGKYKFNSVESILDKADISDEDRKAITDKFNNIAKAKEDRIKASTDKEAAAKRLKAKKGLNKLGFDIDDDTDVRRKLELIDDELAGRFGDKTEEEKQADRDKKAEDADDAVVSIEEIVQKIYNFITGQDTGDKKVDDKKNDEKDNEEKPGEQADIVDSDGNVVGTTNITDVEDEKSASDTVSDESDQVFGNVKSPLSRIGDYAAGKLGKLGKFGLGTLKVAGKIGKGVIVNPAVGVGKFVGSKIDRRREYYDRINDPDYVEEDAPVGNKKIMKKHYKKYKKDYKKEAEDRLNGKGETEKVASVSENELIVDPNTDEEVEYEGEHALGGIIGKAANKVTGFIKGKAKNLKNKVTGKIRSLLGLKPKRNLGVKPNDNKEYISDSIYRLLFDIHKALVGENGILGSVTGKVKGAARKVKNKITGKIKGAANAVKNKITGKKESDEEDKTAGQDKGLADGNDKVIQQNTEDGVVQLKKDKDGDMVEDPSDPNTKKILEARETKQEAYKSIPKITGLVGGLGGIFTGLGSKLFGDGEKKKGLFSTLLESLTGEGSFLGGIFNTITSLFGGSGIASAGKGVLSVVKGLGGSAVMLGVLAGAFSGLFNGLGETIGNLSIFKGNDTESTLTNNTSSSVTVTNDDGTKTTYNLATDDDGNYIKNDEGQYQTTDGTYIDADQVDGNISVVGSDTSVSSQLKKNLATSVVMGSGSVAGKVVASAASKASKAISNSATLTKVASTVTKAASSVVEKSSILSSIVSSLKTVFSKIWSAISGCPLVPKSFRTAVSSNADDLTEKVVGDIAENVSESAVTSSVANAIDDVLVALKVVTLIGTAVNAWGNAESILGITEDATTGQKFIAVCIAVVNAAIPVIGNLIPNKVLVNIFMTVAPMIGIDVSDLAEQREAATAEVEAYNEANGTDLSIEEYNQMEIYDEEGNLVKKSKAGIITKAVNKVKSVATNIKESGVGKTVGAAVSKVGSGIKSVASKVGSTVSNAASSVTSYVSDKVTNFKDTLSESGLGEAIASTVDSVLPGPLGDIGGNVVRMGKLAVTGKFTELMKSNVLETDDDSSMITKVINTILSTIVKIPMTPIAAVTTVVRKIGEGIASIFNKIKALGNIAAEEHEYTNNIMHDTDSSLSDLFKVEEPDEDNPMGGLEKAFRIINRVMYVPVVLIKDVGSRIKKAFSSVVDAVKRNVSGVQETSLAIHEYAKAGDISGVWSYSPAEDEENESPINGFTKATTVITKVFNTPSALIHAAGNAIGEFISNLVEPIKDDYATMDETADIMSEYASDGEVGKVWSTKFETTKGNIIGPLFTGIFNIQRIIYAIIGIVNKVFGAVKNVVSGVTDAVGGVVDTVADGVSGAVDSVKSGISNAASSVWNGITSFVSGSGSGLPKDKKKQTGGASGIDPRAEDTFVSQTDKKYADIEYGSSNVGNIGCAPAAATMLMNYTSPGTITMKEAIKEAKNYEEANGTSADYFQKVLSDYGMSSSYVDTSKKQGRDSIEDVLESGRPAVLLGQNTSNDSKTKSPFGPNRHFITVTGVDSKGNLIVNDPESDETKLYDKSILKSTSLGIATDAPEDIGDVSNFSGGSSYPDNTTSKNVWAYFKNAGYSDAATAGIMGNVYAESGIDPTALQSGKGPAAGLFQWENYTKKSSRWKSLYDYATGKGLDWTSLDAQLPFAQSEIESTDIKNRMSGKTAPSNLTKAGATAMTFDEWKSTSDVNNATRVFEGAFERAGKPNMDKRVSAATWYYNNYNDQNLTYDGSTSATTSSDSTTTTTDSTSSDSGSTSLLDVVSTLSSALSSAFTTAFGGTDTSSTTTTTDSTSSDSSSTSSTTSTGTTVSGSASGNVSSNSEYAEKQKSLVNKMYSVAGTLKYAQNNAKYPGSRNPDDGSGDCSSTVQWAYKNVLGVDPGSYTGAQRTDSDTYTVATSTKDESKLQLGDLLLKDGHVEMYSGNGKMIGHGGGSDGKTLGPTEKALNQKDGVYNLVRRWVGFKGGNSGLDDVSMPTVTNIERRYSGNNKGKIVKFSDYTGGASGTTVASTATSGNQNIIIKLLKSILKAAESIVDNTEDISNINTSITNYAEALEQMTSKVSSASTKSSNSKATSTSSTSTSINPEDDPGINDLIETLNAIAVG